MIKSITVINDLDQSLVLNLTSPEESGFAVKSIDGLGPMSATINTTQIVTTDISLFNSARFEQREIDMKLYLMEKPSIEENRLKSYVYFPIKKKITLIIETENRKLRISGYVKSNEPDIFSNRESIAINIVCPDPYYYSLESDEENDQFDAVEKQFSFPFCNNGLNYKDIEFAIIKSYPTQEIFYTGDYTTGLTIVLHAKNTVRGPKIYNLTTGEVMAINTDKLYELTGKYMIAGDTIVINTTKGSKSVTLTRSGEDINIISCLQSYNTWFELEPGKNEFTYSAVSGGDNLSITYKHIVSYEGI